MPFVIPVCPLYRGLLHQGLTVLMVHVLYTRVLPYNFYYHSVVQRVSTVFSGVFVIQGVNGLGTLYMVVLSPIFYYNWSKECIFAVIPRYWLYKASLYLKSQEYKVS